MRIVLIGPVYPYRGGIVHYTTMLYRAFSAHDHEVLMVSFKRQYPKKLFPGKGDKDPSATPLKVDQACYWIDSLNPLSWVLTFLRIRRYRPDIIVLQWWTTFWAPVWLTLSFLNGLLLRKPLAYICHNVLPHEANWLDTLIARWVLGEGKAFIVQSASEEQQLRNLLPEAQIAVVPHPVNDMFANSLPEKHEALCYLRLPPDVPILLFFGIVRPYKGLEELLYAMPEIQQKLGRVILLIAGEFWEGKARCEQLIEQLGISELVIIDDRYIPNEELLFYFAAADVLIAPYRQVTGSAVVQVALGCGLPVITTSVGGMPGVIHEGENGLLVPPNSSDALAEAVVKYFSEALHSSLPQRMKEITLVSRWDDLVAAIESSVG